MSAWTRLALLMLAALLGACGGGEAAGGGGGEARPARQVIVIVDLSGSQTPEMLTKGKALLGQVIDGLGYGDQIVILEMLQHSPRESARIWTDSVPRLPDPTFISSRDQNRLAGVRQGAHSVANQFFDPELAGKAAHTDIFSTLHVAAEFVRDAGGRQPVLILLSDMYQSANGVEMEHLRQMPPRGWVAAQRRAGLLPRLNGVCITVVGADATTGAGIAVRDFWREYFTAAGTTLEEKNYRLLASRIDHLGCNENPPAPHEAPGD
jgi:hypothetical protein